MNDKQIKFNLINTGNTTNYQEAFEQLYIDNYDNLMNYAQRADYDKAHGYVTDTIIKFATNPNSYNPDKAPIKNYLFKALKNRILNDQKKTSLKQREDVVRKVNAFTFEELPSVEDVFITNEATRIIQDEIRDTIDAMNIQDHRKEIGMKRFLSGYTHSEMRFDYDKNVINPNTVHKSVQVIKQSLKENPLLIMLNRKGIA